MAEVICEECGHPNPLGANFCSSCGSGWGTAEKTTVSLQAVPGPGTGEELSIDLSEIPSGVGVLVVQGGPKGGSRFVLDQDVTTAGRHPDSHIFLDDITVSRRHAEVHRTPEGYRPRRRLAERHLPEPGAHRGGAAGIRRRPPGRQVQVGLPHRCWVTGAATTCPSEVLLKESSRTSASPRSASSSKGLLDPERTPSGYRKFYDDDVSLLRWILAQQRDHFLPLKIIKERLATGDLDGTSSPSCGRSMTRLPSTKRSRGRSSRRCGRGGGVPRRGCVVGLHERRGAGQGDEPLAGRSRGARASGADPGSSGGSGRPLYDESALTIAPRRSVPRPGPRDPAPEGLPAGGPAGVGLRRAGRHPDARPAGPGRSPSGPPAGAGSPPAGRRPQGRPPPSGGPLLPRALVGLTARFDPRRRRRTPTVPSRFATVGIDDRDGAHRGSGGASDECADRHAA